MKYYNSSLRTVYRVLDGASFLNTLSGGVVGTGGLVLSWSFSIWTCPSSWPLSSIWKDKVIKALRNFVAMIRYISLRFIFQQHLLTYTIIVCFTIVFGPQKKQNKTNGKLKQNCPKFYVYMYTKREFNSIIIPTILH